MGRKSYILLLTVLFVLGMVVVLSVNGWHLPSCEQTARVLYFFARCIILLLSLLFLVLIYEMGKKSGEKNVNGRLQSFCELPLGEVFAIRKTFSIDGEQFMVIAPEKYLHRFQFVSNSHEFPDGSLFIIDNFSEPRILQPIQKESEGGI